MLKNGLFFMCLSGSPEPAGKERAVRAKVLTNLCPNILRMVITYRPIQHVYAAIRDEKLLQLSHLAVALPSVIGQGQCVQFIKR